MIYPHNIEEKIEFVKIRELLKAECIGKLGIEASEKIKFSNNKHKIKQWLTQTIEAKKILDEGKPIPKSEYLDLTPTFSRLRAEGSYFEEEELYEFYLSYRTIGRIIEVIDELKEEAEELYKLVAQLNFNNHILSSIELILDEQGKIRDNATPTLSIIRSERKELEERLRGRISKILKKSIEEGYSDEGSLPTIRDGRVVIPVKAENKRLIPGFVHGESATGKTVFLEPAEILSTNNDLKELWYKEKREVFKILFDITELIRPHLFDVNKLYKFQGTIDLIFAKARLAQKLNATIPNLVDAQNMEWVEAVHPLLFLNHRENGKKIVPINIKLTKNERLLLISGPNAGGKSVTLKMTALLQYMLQCGLLIPVKEQSKALIFNKIFVDIGDQQSIENDLSTYSSHLKNMNFFLEHANKSSLMLIDEFGSGTDPQFGAALAEGIIEEFVLSKSYGVITTHYSNLKKLAEEKEGLVNGAMLYDVSKLEPLYALEVGRPGNSFALEIANNLGLKKSIIKKAEKKLGFSQIKYDSLINDLENQLRKAKKDRLELGETKNRLEKSIEQYEELKVFLEKDKKNRIEEAKQEAEKIIDASRKEIERTIREIKEVKAESEPTKKARKELENYKTKLTGKAIEKKRNENINRKPLKKGDFKVGDHVVVSPSKAKATILSVSGQMAEVRIGSLKSRVKLNQLQHSRDVENNQETNLKPIYFDINRAKSEFNTTLDLRGKPVEEALPIFEKFIDNAQFFGEQNLKVIHGKGYGVLRNLVRESLKDYNFIKEVRSEHPDRGGEGISLIELE